MKTSNFFIDGNAPAVKIGNYREFLHFNCGLVEYDPAKFVFFLTEQQRISTNCSIPGKEHLATLLSLPNKANSSFLDFFFNYPDKLRETVEFLKWKFPLYLYSFGDIYQSKWHKSKQRGELFVMYLYMRRITDKPTCHVIDIENEFGFQCNNPTLLLAE